MKDNYTHVSIVLDRSGSMSSCEDVTREGFNTFVTKQQKEKGEATVSLVQFDDQYEVNYEFKNLQDVPLLTKTTYTPRGMTALLDAIGKTINSTGKRLAQMEEKDRPSKVLFVIQTDGFENNSNEFTREKIFEMIKHQREKYQWGFVFLGANQDAIATATSYGISANSAMSYNPINSKAVFSGCLHNFTTAYRSASTSNSANMTTSFSDEDRQTAVNENKKPTKRAFSKCCGK
jgi:hypothetical protein